MDGHEEEHLAEGGGDAGAPLEVVLLTHQPPDGKKGGERLMNLIALIVLLSYLIHATAFLSNCGDEMMDEHAIRVQRPRDTSLTPAGEGGGRQVMRAKRRWISSSENLKKNNLRSAIDQVSLKSLLRQITITNQQNLS